MSRRSTLRLDLITAYGASASKLLSWWIVCAIVFRANVYAYGMLILLRATIGLLNYTSLGLSPALIHLLAQARGHAGDRKTESMPLETSQPSATAPAAPPFTQSVIASAQFLTACVIALGLTLSVLLVHRFASWAAGPLLVQKQVPRAVLAMGLGTTLRVASDVLGSILQSEGKVWLDNSLLIASDLAWIALSVAFARGVERALVNVTISFAVSSLLLLILRASLANVGMPRTTLASMRWGVLRRLLTFGAFVALAQIADFLYAPTDFILIRHLLSPLDLAAYGPAVQVDAGLLLLVSGAAAVILPHAAIAHSARDHQSLVAYYRRGTLLTTLLLTLAAMAVWVLARPLLTFWLKNPLPLTFTILPLVLIHTVAGGSSAIGRSVLLAMGKTRPFTAAVLVAGISNVILSYFCVAVLHWGLKGIVAGTLAAVIGRCALWMPWYIARTLRAVPDQDANRAADAISQQPDVPVADPLA